MTRWKRTAIITWGVPAPDRAGSFLVLRDLQAPGSGGRRSGGAGRLAATQRGGRVAACGWPPLLPRVGAPGGEGERRRGRALPAPSSRLSTHPPVPHRGFPPFPGKSLQGAISFQECIQGLFLSKNIPQKVVSFQEPLPGGCSFPGTLSRMFFCVHLYFGQKIVLHMYNLSFEFTTLR